jgi:hypothetical protein
MQLTSNHCNAKKSRTKILTLAWTQHTAVPRLRLSVSGLLLRGLEFIPRPEYVWFVVLKSAPEQTFFRVLFSPLSATSPYSFTYHGRSTDWSKCQTNHIFVHYLTTELIWVMLATDSVIQISDHELLKQLYSLGGEFPYQPVDIPAEQGTGNVHRQFDW